LIEESKIFEKLRPRPEEFQEKVGTAVNDLIKIIKKKKDNMVNVFKLDSDESCQTIELAILRAHLNSRKKEYYENLKLALLWNRVDIAKTDIFTGEEEFTDKQKSNLLEMALVYNKPDFVELLLESGVDLKSFLTRRRLYFLYNSSIVSFCCVSNGCSITIVV
jgi:ankyrin repeat protein